MLSREELMEGKISDRSILEGRPDLVSHPKFWAKTSRTIKKQMKGELEEQRSKLEREHT